RSRWGADWCDRCPTKIWFSASSDSPSSSRAVTIVRSSTSARPAAIAASSCFARRGACGTSTPSKCSASGLMPRTSCPRRYLARLATRPSCPVATTRSPGSNRKRESSGRFTRARRQSEGIACETASRAPSHRSCCFRTTSSDCPRCFRKKRTCGSVPCRASSASYSLARVTTTTLGNVAAMASLLSEVARAGLQEPGQCGGEGRLAQAEVLDLLQLPRERLCGERQEHRCGDVRARLHPRLLRRGAHLLRGTERAGLGVAAHGHPVRLGIGAQPERLSRGQGLDPPALGLPLRGDARRRGFLGRLALRVEALLG